MKSQSKYILLESFINSFSILLFGFVSIPIVAYMNGVDVNFRQGAIMSIMFFSLRFFWNLFIRIYFNRKY